MSTNSPLHFSIRSAYGHTRSATFTERAAHVRRIKANIAAYPSVPICYWQDGK